MKYPTVNKLFEGICNALRSKTNTTEKIAHQDIPDIISNLNTGYIDDSILKMDNILIDNRIEMNDDFISNSILITNNTSIMEDE